MDIIALEEKLLALNTEIKNILEAVGYKKQIRLDGVIYDEKNMDEDMKYREFCFIFSHLDYVHSLLDYLQKPIIQEGTICLNDKGEYELNGITLNSNDVVEIIVLDKEKQICQWNPVFVSESANLYGKIARIRGYH